MPVCVGARAVGGACRAGGGGASGHTMGRCLAHLHHTRLDDFGRRRLLVARLVPYLGTSRQVGRGGGTSGGEGGRGGGGVPENHMETLRQLHNRSCTFQFFLAQTKMSWRSPLTSQYSR